MKKIISILVLVAMMLSTVLAVIPVSAETFVSKTYNVNWEKLVGEGLMRAQWCYDTSDAQNNYTNFFDVTATEAQLSSKMKKNDARAYYSTVMFDITADTKYEYVFEAKNNPENPTAGAAGVIFAYAENPDGYTRGTGDWDKLNVTDINTAKKIAPYWVQGVFNNEASIGTTEAPQKGIKLDVNFGLDYEAYRLNKVTNADNSVTYNTVKAVAKQSEDGFVKYKVIYDGFKVTVKYEKEDTLGILGGLWGEMFTINLPNNGTAKVAFGVFSRGTQNAIVRNCVLTATNAEGNAQIAKLELSDAISEAEKSMKSVAENYYTPLTTKAVTDAIAAAKALVSATEAKTEKDYTDAKTAIEEAIAKLQETANKTELNDLINTLKDISTDIYEKGTVEYFEGVLTDATAVNNDAEATQKAVDEALALLQNAYKALTIKGAINRTFLKETIDSCKDLDEKDYTVYSWSVYKTAYDAAVALRDDTTNDPVIGNFKLEDYENDEAARDAAFAAAVDTRRKAVNDANIALAAAKEALVNVAELNAIIADAKTLDKTKYTDESWTAADIENKINAAETAIAATESTEEAPALTQDDVTALINEFNAAFGVLKKLADFTELKALVASAEAINKREYVGDAASINKALTDAKAAIAEAEAEPPKVYLQEKVKDLEDALKEAMNALVLRRQNVLYMGKGADEVRDNNYGGIGNVFYYDYHEYVAEKNYTPGVPFEKNLEETGDKANSDYVLRFDTINGSGTAQAGDGNLLSSDFAHERKDVTINGTTYGHAFGFSFYKAPTVDKITFHLPTNTDIASIDVYGAVTTKDGEKTLYGKVSSAEATAGDKETPRFYMGTVTVPAAAEGAQSIIVSGDLEAYKVEYIFFALKFKDGTSGYYKIYEIELYGIYSEIMNGIDIVAADFSTLKAQYDAYRALIKDDYTEASWNKLLEALKVTDVVNKNALSTAEEIASATETLKTALGQLELKPIDKTKLKEAIAAAKAKTNDGFTPKTWEALQNAITAAETLDTSTDKLQQSAIDAATKALNDAIEGLRTRGDTTKLVPRQRSLRRNTSREA